LKIFFYFNILGRDWHTTKVMKRRSTIDYQDNYAPTSKRPRSRRSRRTSLGRPSKAKFGGLNATQVAALSQMVDSKIMKGRELKKNYSICNEQQMDPYTGEAFLLWSGLDTTPVAPIYPNSVDQGDRGQDRDGNQIQPRRFYAKGSISFTESSANASRDSVVRMVWGFVNRAEQITTSESLFMRGGSVSSFDNNFSDIWSDFNWKVFQPFSDQVFTLTPESYVDPTVSANYTMHRGNHYALWEVNYDFGTNAKPITYENNSTGEANSRNIACLVICRNVQDDTIVTTNQIEVSGNSTFHFHDA
jgi:hypothetical protein